MSKRIEKINQLLQRELANLIQEDFSGQLVTVTAVETSADLKQCKVWVCSYLQTEENILKELTQKASGYQSYLGKKLFIKQMPKLLFVWDKSIQQAAKIDKILKEEG